MRVAVVKPHFGNDNCVEPPQYSSLIPLSFLPVTGVSVGGTALYGCFTARGRLNFGYASRCELQAFMSDKSDKSGGKIQAAVQ
jgi:hypothetical protein